MRRLLAAVAALMAICVSDPAWARPQVGAKDLLRSMNGAVGYLAKRVQETRNLEPRNPAHKPFFAALKHADRCLEDLEQRFPTPGKGYFKALQNTALAIEELNATHSQLGFRDPGLEEGLQRLTDTFGTFRTHFSQQALRLRRGGSLTAGERAQLEELRRRNRELSVRLAELEGQISDSSALSREVSALTREARSLASAGTAVQDYVEALLRMERVEGRLRGLEYFVKSSLPRYARHVSSLGPYYYGFGDFCWDVAWSWHYGPAEWHYWGGYNFGWGYSWRYDYAYAYVDAYDEYIRDCVTDADVRELDGRYASLEKEIDGMDEPALELRDPDGVDYEDGGGMDDDRNHDGDPGEDLDDRDTGRDLDEGRDRDDGPDLDGGDFNEGGGEE